MVSSHLLTRPHVDRAAGRSSWSATASASRPRSRRSSRRGQRHQGRLHDLRPLGGRSGRAGAGRGDPGAPTPIDIFNSALSSSPIRQRPQHRPLQLDRRHVAAAASTTMPLPTSISALAQRGGSHSGSPIAPRRCFARLDWGRSSDQRHRPPAMGGSAPTTRPPSSVDNDGR